MTKKKATKSGALKVNTSGSVVGSHVVCSQDRKLIASGRRILCLSQLQLYLRSLPSLQLLLRLLPTWLNEAKKANSSSKYANQRLARFFLIMDLKLTVTRTTTRAIC